MIGVAMDVGIEDVEEILLVDDNPGDIRLIEEAFRESPLDPSIHATRTRDEALDVLFRRGDHEETPRPDLVLLDWRLSQETGEEVVEAAKTGELEIPVVVMTGSKAGLGRIESAAQAADEYIEKKTDPEAYIDVLRSVGPDR